MSGSGHGFGDGSGECNHVVPGGLFNFEAALHTETGVLAEEPGILVRDNAHLGERFSGREFNFQPLLKSVLVGPDGTHFGASVAGNQAVKTSVFCFCSAITRFGFRPRFSSVWPAPTRTISGWLLCSLR